MREVVIASTVRTAMGSFGGSLKNVSAVDLEALVIKEAVKRAIEISKRYGYIYVDLDDLVKVRFYVCNGTGT